MDCLDGLFVSTKSANLLFLLEKSTTKKQCPLVVPRVCVNLDTRAVRKYGTNLSKQPASDVFRAFSALGM